MSGCVAAKGAGFGCIIALGDSDNSSEFGIMTSAADSRTIPRTAAS